VLSARPALKLFGPSEAQVLGELYLTAFCCTARVPRASWLWQSQGQSGVDGFSYWLLSPPPSRAASCETHSALGPILVFSLRALLVAASVPPSSEADSDMGADRRFPVISTHPVPPAGSLHSSDISEKVLLCPPIHLVYLYRICRQFLREFCHLTVRLSLCASPFSPSSSPFFCFVLLLILFLANADAHISSTFFVETRKRQGLDGTQYCGDHTRTPATPLLRARGPRPSSIIRRLRI
jgi:hypothetical protein